MDAGPDRFEDAAQSVGDFEMAQLGDLHWASSTLRDLDLPHELRQPWLAEIAALEAKIRAGLTGIARSIACRDAADCDRAHAHQVGLWTDIEDFLRRLAGDIPAVLDSEWLLPPPVRDMKNIRDRSAT